jgi:hypothetical protein
MSTQPTTQLVQWQNLKVKSEVDIVLEIAHQKGWQDCEIFGHGSMITQPQESNGWKLLPADLYEYSIPSEGVARVLQTINAGVRIQGVVIADDERRTVPQPIPTKPKVSLPSVKTVVSFIGIVLLGLIVVACIIKFPSLVLIGAALVVLFSAATAYDPKLIILVDDGNGGTVWISLLTWYE